MLYAERNKKGEITSITSNPQEDKQEQVSETEALDFLTKSGDLNSHKELLSRMDSSFIRVLDDLIDLLISKNIIMFTELPEKARQKVSERKNIRHQLRKDSSLMVDDIL